MKYLYKQQHPGTQSSLSLQEPPCLSLDPSLSSERQQWKNMQVYIKWIAPCGSRTSYKCDSRRTYPLGDYRSLMGVKEETVISGIVLQSMWTSGFRQYLTSLIPRTAPESAELWPAPLCCPFCSQWLDLIMGYIQLFICLVTRNCLCVVGKCVVGPRRHSKHRNTNKNAISQHEFSQYSLLNSTTKYLRAISLFS